MEKAAIVIGINSAGELPVLRAAASGAQSFGAWLSGEGFNVQSFVDDDRPVTAAAIFESVTALIDRGPPAQLVVYFSGHGFLRSYDELWMLSGAPRNANEAVSVRESVELARECGIASVVMISDACRSTPQSLSAERVQGSLIFPNEASSCNIRPEIDRYFAALPGDPALETTVDKSVGQHEGVFTHCFLQAYRHPDPEMVRQVTFEGKAIPVIPNRSLKEYLRRRVPAFMHDRGLMVRQIPDAIVESGESVYIGRVMVPADAESRKARPREFVGVRDVARGKLGPFSSGVHVPDLEREAVQEVATNTGFDSTVELIGKAQEQGAGHFETKTGFKVFGTRVSEVVGLDMGAELLNGGGAGEPAYVRLHPNDAIRAGRASSVALRFTEGSGAVLAGLRDYIGTVVVENGRLVNVSYVPSDNSARWPYYLREGPRLGQFRAIAAAAARFGVFRVDRENASHVADQIRYLKSVDPTLGLYATYAYAEVGLSEQVRGVLNYMGEDLQTSLFDVAMLAGKLADSSFYAGVVPFCPMLSQGWTLLRVKRARVPPLAEEAAKHLLPALWTTFDPAGMDLIFRGIREKRLS